MKEIPRNCTLRMILIAPSRIHYLRFIMEAYEGLALVTTLDARMGAVQLSIAPGCEEDVQAVLESEQMELGLRPFDFNA